jgi:hypothetical protein
MARCVCRHEQKSHGIGERQGVAGEERKMLRCDRCGKPQDVPKGATLVICSRCHQPADHPDLVSELLPCPFCGAKGEVVHNTHLSSFWYPTCSGGDCIATVVVQDEQGGAAVECRTKQEAVDEWNRRQAQSAAIIDEFVGRVERRVREYPGSYPGGYEGAMRSVAEEMKENHNP